MKCSMCADIMFVAPGEHGPVWPDAEGLSAAMDLAKKNGIYAIEIFEFEGRDLSQVAAASKEKGVSILSACQKNGKFWGTPDKINEFVEGFKESVPKAKKLGVKNLVVSDELYPRDLPREEVHNAMVEGLKQLAPLAEKEDIIIWAEPLSGAYFRDAKEPFDIIREVGSRNVRILYDIFHFQQFAGNIINTIKENVEWIGHIHGAGVPERGDLTESEIDYSYVLEAIKKTGYDRYFGLEFFTFEKREEKVWKSAKLAVSNDELREKLAKYFATNR